MIKITVQLWNVLIDFIVSRLIYEFNNIFTGILSLVLGFNKNAVETRSHL